MIRLFFVKKIIQSVLPKILEGNKKGLHSYFKKAAILAIVFLVFVVILIIFGIVFVAQLLIGAFTHAQANIDSVQAKKDAIVTEIVDTTKIQIKENLASVLQETKEVLTPTISTFKGE